MPVDFFGAGGEAEHGESSAFGLRRGRWEGRFCCTTGCGRETFRWGYEPQGALRSRAEGGHLGGRLDDCTDNPQIGRTEQKVNVGFQKHFGGNLFRNSPGER